MKNSQGADSVRQLIERLHSETTSDEAAEELWRRLFDRLVIAASKKLKGLPRRSVDEEDVALSVFNAFVEGVHHERFEQLQNDGDLWQILLMLTKRKAIGVLRRELAEKRGGGDVRGESVFNTVLADGSESAGLGNQPDPLDEWADYFNQDVQGMLAMLDPVLKNIAMLRLEGQNNRQIAAQLGIALRSVERKIGVIKEKWAEAVEP